MNKRKLMQRTFIVMLIVLLVSVYGQMHAQPMSGDWIAPTGFGEFVLTVNSAGTHITKIKYTFSNYTIGSVTKNGSVSIGTTPGWLISGNQFNITNTLDPGGNEKMTVRGTFTGNGNQAVWNLECTDIWCFRCR